MKWAYFTSGFRKSRGKHTGTKANAHAVRDLFEAEKLLRKNGQIDLALKVRSRIREISRIIEKKTTTYETRRKP